MKMVLQNKTEIKEIKGVYESAVYRNGAQRNVLEIRFHPESYLTYEDLKTLFSNQDALQEIELYTDSSTEGEYEFGSYQRNFVDLIEIKYDAEAKEYIVTLMQKSEIDLKLEALQKENEMIFAGLLEIAETVGE